VSAKKPSDRRQNRATKDLGVSPKIEVEPCCVSCCTSPPLRPLEGRLAGLLGVTVRTGRAASAAPCA